MRLQIEIDGFVVIDSDLAPLIKMRLNKINKNNFIFNPQS